MQRLRFFLDGAGNRGRDQRGWVLMDALWSSVVVMLAFIGTTMAFNGGQNSVARDAQKTYAMTVAQKQLEQMRSQGQVDISTLTYDSTNSAAPVSATNGYDGRVETIAYKGVNYTVAYNAYYVTGLGDNTKDACGSPYAANGSTARYIYMRVKVTYAGQTSGATASNGSYTSTPAMLDAYFAPEGGAAQANTGTLRVYVLDRNDQVASGITSISISQGSPTAGAFQTQNVVSNGCVLFTGLPRATYYIKVATTKEDLYLSNPTGVQVVQKVVMPYRGALSRIVRVDTPNTVTGSFRTLGGTNGTTEIQVPVASTSSALVGPWVAMNDEIVTDPTNDFAAGPGRTYMPHIAGGSNTTIKNQLFPMKNGYSAFAGPCNVNNPDDAALTGNEWLQIPASLTDTNWNPGGNYSTGTQGMWLAQMRSRIRLSNIPTTRPSTGLQPNTSYYWGQALTSGKVNVKLTGDQTGNGIYEHCGANESLFNSWVRLPGAVDNTTGYLPDLAEAIPSGWYDVCAYATISTNKQTTNSVGTFTGTTATTATFSMYRIIGDQKLAYKGNANPDFNFDNPRANEGTSADCSGANWT
jgi:hypothetical protein